jgi:hypothetical protein
MMIRMMMIIIPWSNVLPEKLNRFSATQEIARIYCKTKVHYVIHKSPPPVRILREINLVHAHPTSSRSSLILFYIYA